MLTCDALFNNKLVIYQQKRGYRFSVDAVLLAGLTRVRRDDHILDLGTGCGVISQSGETDRGVGGSAGARGTGKAEC